MNTLKLSIIAILFAFQPSAYSAEPFGSNTEYASQSVLQAQFSTQLKNINPVPGNFTGTGASAIYIPNIGEATNPRLKILSVRSNSLSGGIAGTGMLVSNDRVYSSVYVPMQGINNALSLVETALQYKLADSLVTLVQAISLVARRQANTELSYSVKVNNYSRVNSTITCRLHPGTNSGNSEVMASLRYNSRF